MEQEGDSENITETYSAFGRSGLIAKLADQIDNHLDDDSPSIEPSLVVGILGEWGSGKSTILQGLEYHYNQQLNSPANNGITLPVFFNPWRFENEVHLIVPLLKTAQASVKRYLNKHQDQTTNSFKSSAVKLGQTAIALATALKGKVSIPYLGELEFNLQDALDKEEKYLKANADDAQTVDFDSIYFDLHEQMEQITGRSNESGTKLNLLFLIDDLDRCLPEKAVQVMESVKLFLDARGCAFVLALDEEVVERGIVHRYRDYLFQGGSKDGAEKSEKDITQLPITGAEYLEKIIQLPIHLPRPDDNGIREFLLNRFPDLFIDRDFQQNKDGMDESRRKDAGSPLLELFLKAIPPIPRKHVRAATLLVFLLSLAKEQGVSIDHMTLARLVILQLFAPELYRHGKRNPGFLLAMEQWAEEHGPAWSSRTLVDRLLADKKKALEDLTKSKMSGPEDDAAKPAKRSESITTLEGDRTILHYISLCTQNRGEFDPRNLINPDHQSDKEIARYFTFIEKRTTRATWKGQRATITSTPVANIGDVDAFIEQLLSDREDAWVNAIQSEIESGEVIPQLVFEKVLEKLDEFPGELWLAQVVPVLNNDQREELKERFKAEYESANAIVRNAQIGSTEKNAWAGRILGWLGDNRKGVGLDSEGLPDIEWVEIETPNVAYVLDENKHELRLDKKGNLVLDYQYKMARYPVTWAQYQSFVDQPDGYQNDEWWQGLELDSDDRKMETASWPIPNHPCETVNWFQCMAFCRWLNEVKNPGGDQVISLPTEWEWQHAANGGDSENFLYPWGENYKPGYANINETLDNTGKHNLGKTTSVGLYPPGENGLLDMSGNVWEWCLNQGESKEINDISTAGTAARALRGGSWGGSAEDASSVYRDGGRPGGRGDGVGFRVVCVPSNRRNSDR